MPASLYRIILFGQDIIQLKNFYIHHFNLALLEQIEDKWVVLKSGPMEIALHKVGGEYEDKTGQRFKAGSNTKLVFSITKNIESFRQQLLNAGVFIKEVQSFAGMNALFCDGEDPEGNVFQLEQRLD